MSEENTNQKENSISQESQETLLKQLKECQAQNEEWKDRFLRAVAEFENSKKRMEKEKLQWIMSAQASLLQDVIAIVDDFDRAFEQGAQGGQTGFELIYKQLQKLLEKYGVTHIKEVAHFDPMLHEAIMQVESPNHKPGDIVQVLQKGYKYKNEVLRPAKVSVAK